MSNLTELTAEIEAARDAAKSAACLENLTIEVHADSVVVAGNRAGLLELARLVVMVASQGQSGSHQDIDRSTFASSADRVLTIALNKSLT